MSQPTVIVQLSNPTVIAAAAGAPGPQGPAGSGGSTLARTTVKTGAYTAAAGDLVPVDTTSAPVTVTLPSAPADKTQVAVVLVTQGGSNTVTVACAGSDVLSKTGGPTTLTLALGQLAWLEYTAAGGIWTQLAGPQSPTGTAGGDLTGSYPSPTLAATANVEAIIRANRLDQFAAPTAAVSLAGQKVTSLANGTLSSDAAAVGQIPTALPPTGTATGDLGGTYPAPTVTATHLAAPLPPNQGGTGQATAAAALTALAGTQAAGRYLRSDGTNTALAAIQAGDIPTLNQATTGTAANVTGVVALANGGSGQSTQASALTALTGAQSAGAFVRSDGVNAALAAIQAADVPVLNQSTTGTAANVTGTVALAHGGTGQVTQQTAINALTGTQAAGTYLRSDGTNAALTAIQAVDVPVLNQNTTGTAAGLSSTLAIGSGGTGQTGAAAAFNALSPVATLGDLIYGSGANAAARLPGVTAATKAFLTQAGTGTLSAAPAWAAISAGDVPTLNQNTTGTAANVSGTVAVANGGTGAATVTGARTALGVYQHDTPAQRGWAEWNYPPSPQVAVSQNLTSGTIYGVSLICQTNTTISKVGVQVVSSASTPTAGQNLIGFYTISGTTATQQTVTGDLGTWSSNGFNSYALGAAQTLVAGSTILLLFMSNATTPVHLQGVTSDTAAQIGFLNIGLSGTAAPWLKFFVNATAQTVLPASFAISGTTMTGTNALAPWAVLL